MRRKEASAAWKATGAERPWLMHWNEDSFGPATRKRDYYLIGAATGPSPGKS
jgi:hypothetical protein